MSDSKTSETSAPVLHVSLPPESLRPRDSINAPRDPKSEKIIRVACILGLIALPMMAWSVIDARVWPVLVALSIGQGIGTLSFLLYLYVVIRDTKVLARIGLRKKKT